MVSAVKVTRNSSCPCGSGKKYKHCCWKRNKRFSNVSQDPISNKSQEWFFFGFSICVLIVVGFFCYLNSFSNEFIFDDLPQIRDNPHLRQLWPLAEIFENTRRPFLYLTFAVNYALGKLNVWGYHLLNLFIHMAAALVLFGIVRRTLLTERFKTRWKDSAGATALTAAILWLVHPLQTQSVAYIVQRAESLAGFFYLLTLYAFIRYCELPLDKRWQWAAIISCLLGITTKEVAVSAPIVIFLYDRVFLSNSFREIFRKRKRVYLGLLFSWLMLGILLVTMKPEVVPTAGFNFVGISPVQYALTQCQVIPHYLKLVFWPRPLVFDYDGWSIAKTLVDVWPGFIVVVSLLAGSIWLLFRRSALGFLGLAFFLILMPSSSFMPLKDVAFEYRMYLPLAVLTIWVSILIFSIRTRYLALGMIVLITAGLSYLTYQRNKDYRNDFVIWQDTLTKWPNNSRAHNNFGEILFRQGKLQESEEHYRNSIRLNPDYADVRSNLGILLSSKGQRKEAIEQFQEALRVEPNFAIAHNNLAANLVDEGHYEEALRHYFRTLELEFQEPGVYNNIGIAYGRLGRYSEAVKYLQGALHRQPDFPQAQQELQRIQRLKEREKP